MRDEIVVRPNDRLIRGVLVLLPLAYALSEGAEGLALLMVFVPPVACLLAWVTLGQWVYRSNDGDLVIDCRIADVVVWRTEYPIASISGFRIEERRQRIKGNMSVRYSVLLEGVNGTPEIAWRRERSDAETLAGELQTLTRVSGSREKGNSKV